MALESGTWVEDLVPTNPPSTDDKRQGDDHLRLIKSVLKNTFKRTSGRPVYFPTSINLSGDYNVLISDENTIFRCNTNGGGINVNLPVGLTTANAGWKIFIYKTTFDNNAVFVNAAAETTIDTLGTVTRVAELRMTEVSWTGNEFTVSRPLSVPIGTVLEYYGVNVPNGFLWADGGTFDTTKYPGLFTVLGTNIKPDLRGRVSIGKDDMGGLGASRITSGGSGISGITLGAAGGAEVITLVGAQLPGHSHAISATHQHGPGTITVDSQGDHFHAAFLRDPGHFHTTQVHDPANLNGGAQIGAGGNETATGLQSDTKTTGAHVNSTGSGAPNDDKTANAGAHTHTANGGLTAAASPGSTDNTGGNQSHQNVPPAIICNKIIVAE